MEVDEKTWESEVIRRSGETPVVVDFWAEWCKPCKALTPVLEEAVEQRDVVLATVDVEANKNLAREYGIASIPAVKAFKNGREVSGFVGVKTRTMVDTFLDELTKPPVAEELDDAEITQALTAGDYDRAFQILIGARGRSREARGREAGDGRALRRARPGSPALDAVPAQPRGAALLSPGQGVTGADVEPFAREAGGEHGRRRARRAVPSTKSDARPERLRPVADVVHRLRQAGRAGEREADDRGERKQGGDGPGARVAAEHERGGGGEAARDQREEHPRHVRRLLELAGQVEQVDQRDGGEADRGAAAGDAVADGVLERAVELVGGGHLGLLSGGRPESVGRWPQDRRDVAVDRYNRGHRSPTAMTGSVRGRCRRSAPPLDRGHPERATYRRARRPP